MIKKTMALLLALLMVMGLAACAAPTTDAEPTEIPAEQPAETPAEAPAALYTPGTYTATVNAMHGPMTVEVTVSESAITDVKVTEQMETPGVGEVAANEIPKRIVEQQSLAVDVVAGVTISSVSVLSAVEECLKQAGADIEALKAPITEEPSTDVEDSADVIIVGGGGAGLSSAVAATDAGASVILVEKMGFVGGNSIVAGGIYNAPDASLQDYALKERSESLETLIIDAISETPVSEEHKELMEAVKKDYEEYKESDKTLFDSTNWFALQTWNGGDKLADLKIVKILTASALDGLKWMESMGMEFKQSISHGGGSLYPRTHSAVLPNGSGYIKAFTDKLNGNQNFKLMLNTNATGLIMDGDKVVGVNAVGKDGNKVTLTANKGVILATGGFAGNVELRQKYCQGEKWPDLGPNVPTSNMPGVTGDGIFFAEDAGAELVNMDQIQLLPYCNPQTGATYDIVMGSGSSLFINKEGKRFVREDGRRDEMSKAIIAQTDGIMYLLQSADSITDPATQRALGGQLLSYYLENNYAGYVSADTLDELAEKLNVPAENLKQTVAEYNEYVDSGKADPFGRVSYSGKLENGPFYAYPRKPAVHHTMGGVKIDEKAHALKADGSVVSGLYCAGEITGVIHGSNRLGGNAIVDFVVFGRIAGSNAAKGE
jgi:fumarate reductase flavoprotein subunit